MAGNNCGSEPLDLMALDAYRIAAEHGFWEPDEHGAPRNFGELIALIHSEASEALEQHRAGKPLHYLAYRFGPVEKVALYAAGYDPAALETILVDSKEPDEIVGRVQARQAYAASGLTPKPEGVAVELIDVIIRCLDTLASLPLCEDGQTIQKIFDEKMAYNRSRPHKHGKAY